MSISRSISRTSAGWTRPAATRWTPSLGPTRLDPKRSYKPLDVGNGIVSGTVTPNGRWLSLGISHPVHGRVVLSDADAFPDDQRLEQGAVRAYRASLASPSRKGFGLALLASGEAEAFLVEDSLPLAVLDHPGYARFETLTLAPRGRTGALQIVRVAAHEQNIGVGIEWHGRMRLGRAAYTQLTAGGAVKCDDGRGRAAHLVRRPRPRRVGRYRAPNTREPPGRDEPAVHRRDRFRRHARGCCPRDGRPRG